MLRIKKITISLALCFTMLFSVGPLSNTATAQCPMCRMSAESNLKAGGTAGKGLNRGILYLFAMPYLLVGTIGFIWWRNQTTNDDIPM